MKVQLMVLMEALDHQINIEFTKVNTNFAQVCRIMQISVICLVLEKKEIFKFKIDNKIVKFPTQFCFRSMSSRFSATESREVFLSGNEHDFSVDYNSNDKYDILI